MVSCANAWIILPKYVLDDLIRFINDEYQRQLPHSLLIAQAFILKHQDYGREYGLPAINHAVEERI